MREIRLDRGTIRTRAAQRMGWDTSVDALTAPVKAQIEAFIEEGYRDIAARCPWANQLRTCRIDTAEGQSRYNYPTADDQAQAVACDAGSVVAVARWDADAQAFIPLRRSRIRPEHRADPIYEDADPDNDAEFRGPPRYFDCLSQITLAPQPDGVYDLMIYVQDEPDITLDPTVVPCDGEALLRYVVARLYQHEGDHGGHDRQMARCEQRIRELRRAQGAGEGIIPGRAALIERTQTDRLADRRRYPGTEPFTPSS